MVTRVTGVVLQPALNALGLVSGFPVSVSGVHLTHELLQPFGVVRHDKLVFEEEAGYHVPKNGVAKNLVVDLLTIVTEEILGRKLVEIGLAGVEGGVEVGVASDRGGGTVRISDGLTVRSPVERGIKPGLVHDQGQGDGVLEARVVAADFGKAGPAATENVATVATKALINHDLIQVDGSVDVGDEVL